MFRRWYSRGWRRCGTAEVAADGIADHKSYGNAGAYSTADSLVYGNAGGTVGGTAE